LRARCKLGADSMKSVLLSKARPRWAKPLVAVTEREIAAIYRYPCVTFAFTHSLLSARIELRDRVAFAYTPCSPTIKIF
jgi:hypothetical protein